MTTSAWFNVVINPHFEVSGVTDVGDASQPLLGTYLARRIEAPFEAIARHALQGQLRAIELRVVADAPPVYLLDSHALAAEIDWYYFPHRSALFTPTASSLRQANSQRAQRLISDSQAS